jgi:hypothetical protein
MWGERIMRKVLTFIVTMGLLISSLPVNDVVAASELRDIANHWAKSSIEQAVSTGYVSGYPGGTFKPNNSVSRAEFIKMIVDDLGLPHGIDDKVWYQPYVDAAVNNEIHAVIDFKDYTKPITRLEITRLISRALIRNEDYKAYLDSFKGLYNGDLPFVDYREFEQEDLPYLALSFGAKIISGYPDVSFGIDKQATRAEAVVMLNNFDSARAMSPEKFAYLTELKEIAETGMNIKEFTDLIPFVDLKKKDVVTDTQSYTSTLKRVYIIPLTGNKTSLLERKFLWDRNELPDIYKINRFGEVIDAYVISVLDVTYKTDGNHRLIGSNAFPSKAIPFIYQTPRIKFGFMTSYPGDLLEVNKGETKESVLYSELKVGVEYIYLNANKARSGHSYLLFRMPEEG